MDVGQEWLVCMFHLRDYHLLTVPSSLAFIAKKLCPHLIIVPLHFERYAEKASPFTSFA